MERQLRPQLAVAEEAIALYDTYWFRRLVLSNACPPPAPLPLPPAAPEREQPEKAPAEESKSELQRSPSVLQRHRRTRSDEAKAAAFHGQLEPLKIPSAHRARLQTILSGKDGLAAPVPQPLPERRRPEARRPGAGRRRRSRRGRSLSELEFEEVKGLQDLGFTFSETEVDAELASIVPGLRRLRAEEEAKRAKAAAAEEAEEEACRRNRAAAAPRRPYLSEAWEDEEAEVRRMLSNFRIPAAADALTSRRTSGSGHTPWPLPSGDGFDQEPNLFSAVPWVE